MSNETITGGKNCEEAPDSRPHPLPPGVEPGSEVSVRGRRWIVRRILPHEDCTELYLTSATEPRGRVLLWPFDRPVAQRRVRQLRAVTLRQWWRHAARLFTAARVDGLCARFAAARVLPYQLMPALAVANGSCRVLLADEVGLGKTVQAGWIISDILHRRQDARVLVAVPAGLRRQWQSELETQFAIDAIAADADWLRRTYADFPADVDPWSLSGVYVTSIDFVKRTEVLRSLEQQTWDALIVDEAHTAAAPTERHAAVSRIASRARVVILITATPFSGDPAAFASLVGLGSTRDEPPLMFRRFREDVGAPRSRRHHFAAIRISNAERRLQRLLERYTEEVWNAAPNEGARLAMTVLRKRALSSSHAVARSLERRRELLALQSPAPRQLTLFDEVSGCDDEEPLAALGAPGLADERREQRWLSQLIAAAESATDSKRRFVLRLLRRLRGEAAIVFTEYRDTLLLLSESFPGCLTLHGGMTPAERAEVQARFNEHGGVLLATDAASEGLNLQRRCRLIVCYELPWNPARLEQRIGRVDRVGQSRRVHAITLVASDTAEDLVIAKLVRKLTRVAATFGERDRLAGFLTDARMAGMVIGRSLEEPSASAPLPRVCIGPALTNEAVFEAGRLSQGFNEIWSPDANVRVSSIAERTVAEGFVFLFAWSAIDGEGHLVDLQPTVIHVRVGRVERPRSRADARELAHAAVRRFEQHAFAVAEPIAARRLAHARLVHTGRVDQAIARELELGNWHVEPKSVQPGLFDRRAVTNAAEESALRQRTRLAHDDRTAALLRSRELTSRCDLVAVLCSWSRPGSGSTRVTPRGSA
jgi:superfamily II DNA or RNA helicase